ncbi:MAG: tripartite tricarboxylate transporter substrate binding protein [Syntrophales bacterium LBB04]|nr:tripartite tricarboxylate transporter substrate binding protein [Syntrophales bacterium LBB04]
MKHCLLNTSLTLFLSAILTFVFAGGAYSEEESAKYPRRPINFIVALTPGATGDMACRFIAKAAEKYLGQPIVVINKPGGGTSIGIEAIATAKPDGYTIGYAPHSGIFVEPLLAKLPYNPVTDLTPIMQFGSLLFGISVKANAPFKSFADIISHARQNPKKLTYGSTGPNNMQFFIISQIAKKEKVEFLNIPSRGGPESHTALLGGNLDFIAATVVDSLLDAGEERLLLVLSDERSPEYPDVPSLRDLGFDIPAPMIFSVVGPKGIPAPILSKIEDAFTKAMKDPTFVKGMRENLRYPIAYRNSKELGEYINRNVEAYRKILKEMNMIK